MKRNSGKLLGAAAVAGTLYATGGLSALAPIASTVAGAARDYGSAAVDVAKKHAGTAAAVKHGRHALNSGWGNYLKSWVSGGEEDEFSGGKKKKMLKKRPKKKQQVKKTKKKTKRASPKGKRKK